MKEKLIEMARNARENAYTPFSRFKVGAAVLGNDGSIYTGCNIENSSYGLTNCAERTAVFNAVSKGVNKIEAVAVIADTLNPVSPCGACRQVLSEFCDSDTKVFLANLKGDVSEWLMSDLLPGAFVGSDIKAD